MGTDFRYAKPDASSKREPVPFDEEELKKIPGYQRRWAWLEISSDAIRHNTQAAKRALRGGCRLMAVVKADGYGHGAIQCARTSLATGAECLGVATVDEALHLRHNNIKAPIMLLAEPPIESIPLLLHYHITPAVYTLEFAIAYGEVADAHGMTAPFHLAVNTGMNRIGIRHDEVTQFLMQIGFHRALDQVGTFTHFATADCEETLDFQIQLRRFKEAVHAIASAGFDPGVVHAANSAAIYRYPEAHFDMARLGIALYGFYPCKETYSLVNLKPAMSVKTRITAVKSVPIREGVSYGLHYRSPGSVKICTIPVGYADGFRRGLSNRTDVILQGSRFPQVGNICMDQCMFEVDMRSRNNRLNIDPHVGDVVTLVGSEGGATITIDEQAQLLGTNHHEIAIGYSHRMLRYWK